MVLVIGFISFLYMVYDILSFCAKVLTLFDSKLTDITSEL